MMNQKYSLLNPMLIKNTRRGMKRKVLLSTNPSIKLIERRLMRKRKRTGPIGLVYGGRGNLEVINYLNKFKVPTE